MQGEERPTETQRLQLVDGIFALQADADRSKLLSVYAVLNFESGEEYTPQEYVRAIKWLDMLADELRNERDAFILKGKQWLYNHMAALPTA